MFELLIWAVVGVIASGMVYAYAGSRDVFHPVMITGPILLFIYAYMPNKLSASGGLSGFFQPDQLEYVQLINLVAIACFVQGCLSIGCRLPAVPSREPLSQRTALVLVIGGTLIGCIGLAAWLMAIINVGGLSAAFSEGGMYSGGWDDNGYVRDASLLMYPAFLLILAAATRTGFRYTYLPLLLIFICPWAMQAILTSKRGPTFVIAVVISLGWYMNQDKRPPLLLVGGAGLLLGFLMLFLVTNRQYIHLGASQDEFSTDVSNIIEKPDTGNEYIYGTGTMLSAEHLRKFYWGRRYLAQVAVRPIPSSIWPTKYEDFGVPELKTNAGTGEGLSETLGWSGADGSAPGIIADLWLEFYWLNMPVLWLIGRFFGSVWKNTHLRGRPWTTMYIFMAALSIYFVMQTMEAVIFRLLLMSVPSWIVWSIALRRKEPSKIAGIGTESVPEAVWQPRYKPGLGSI